MADLFYEIKAGNLAAATNYAAEALAAEKSREDTNVRLDRLEKAEVTDSGDTAL